MKNEEVVISVIMCVYNTKKEYLIQAVESIMNQTFKQFELIVVDDASSIDLYDDDIFNDCRINIIREKINHGPAYSRNIALRMAKGKYIAIMDSDDISLPQRLEKQVTFLEEKKEYVACGTWFKFIGNKDHEVRRIIDDNEYYRCSLLFGNIPTILNPSIMMRKDVLTSNKINYDEQLLYGEDYKMWVQLTEVGKITNINETLLFYRVHDSQLTNKKQRRSKSFKDDSCVREYIIGKLKLDLNESERKAFFAKNGLKHVDPIEYRHILDKIIASNNISHYYKENSLEQRVDEQWKKILYSTNNAFKWIKIILCLKKYRKEAIRIKREQIKNIINKN